MPPGLCALDVTFSAMPKARSDNALADVLAQLAKKAYEDPKGFAGGKLAKDMGYTSPAATNNILRQAERDGLVTRTMSGRRTYSICLTEVGRKTAAAAPPRVEPEAPAAAPAPAPTPISDDILQFATLLQQASQALINAPEVRHSEVVDTRLTRRLGDALEECNHLRRELERIKGRYDRLVDDHKAVRFERDGLRQRLQMAEENVAKLQSRLPHTADRSGKATARLMAEVPRTGLT